MCRYCCKSLFAQAIKNFPGFRRDFRVKMWRTSSPDDKLADDLGSAIEGKRISGRRSDFFTAGKLAPGNLGLLQQYRLKADVGVDPQNVRYGPWRCENSSACRAHRRFRQKSNHAAHMPVRPRAEELHFSRFTKT